MNDVNVSSKNQSGGITAKTVNVGNRNQFNVAKASQEENPFKTIFWWIFGLVGAIAGGIAIYKFFAS